MSRLSAGALALGAFIALAPVDAFAWGGHGGAWHGPGAHFGWRYGRSGFFRRPILSGYPYPYPYYFGNSGYDPGCLWVRQLVPTPYGPQWRVTPACPYGY